LTVDFVSKFTMGETFAKEPAFFLTHPTRTPCQRSSRCIIRANYGNVVFGRKADASWSFTLSVTHNVLNDFENLHCIFV
jgi:hypothetical protein